MGPTRCWATPVLLFALAAVPAGASAQRPAGADTLSPAAVAESLKVLKTLRAQLDQRKNQSNADLWYHRGMLTWALYLRDRANGGLRELDWTLLGREMDSSIRLASELAPKNVRYQLTKGQYFASSGLIFVSIQSLHTFDVALERARASGDPQLIAEAAIEKGRVHWRRYGGVGAMRPSVVAAARGVDDDDRRRSANTFDMTSRNRRSRGDMNSLLDGRDFYGHIIPRKNGDFSGELDYYKAEEFFREAYHAKPTYARAFMQLAMLLEARQRWTELASLARERIAAEPQHAWAWMTLGLVLHRTGNSAGALIAFDKGLSFMNASERTRVDNIERVMRPSDSAMVRGWSAAERKSFEDWYWVWSAPMWSLEETKPRAEFLARISAAELRWTNDDFGKRGADTDRGNVLVRYGPGNGAHGAYGSETWWYDYSGLAFYFGGVPSLGTVSFTNRDDAVNMMDSIPARWDNLLRVRVDSLPVRVARFRAGDSLDVAFSYLAPVDSIRESAQLDVPVRVNFWLFNEAFKQPQHDTTDLKTTGSVTVARRVPLGSYLYRFEATNDASAIGARATARVRALPDSSEEFYLSGFGVSDLLVGSHAVPRGAPRRWTDFDFTASPAEFAPGSELALVWENYDLADHNGAAEYSVKLIIERHWQMALNRVRQRIVRAFDAMFGIEQTYDRVIFRYERQAPSAPIIPDYLTVTLTDMPEAYYDVTVEVTDHVTGKVADRTTRILVKR